MTAEQSSSADLYEQIHKLIEDGRITDAQEKINQMNTQATLAAQAIEAGKKDALTYTAAKRFTATQTTARKPPEP